jgi:hypothetical protein
MIKYQFPWNSLHFKHNPHHQKPISKMPKITRHKYMCSWELFGKGRAMSEDEWTKYTSAFKVKHRQTKNASLKSIGKEFP